MSLPPVTSHNTHSHNYPTSHTTTIQAYRSSKARQKLKYLRITEALELDDDGVCEDIEKLALYAVLHEIGHASNSSRELPRERTAVRLSTQDRSVFKSELSALEKCLPQSMPVNKPIHSPITSNVSMVVTEPPTKKSTPSPQLSNPLPQSFETPANRYSSASPGHIQTIPSTISSSSCTTVVSRKRKRENVSPLHLVELVSHIRTIENIEAELVSSLPSKQRKTQDLEQRDASCLDNGITTTVIQQAHGLVFPSEGLTTSLVSHPTCNTKAMNKKQVAEQRGVHSPLLVPGTPHCKGVTQTPSPSNQDTIDQLTSLRNTDGLRTTSSKRSTTEQKCKVDICGKTPKAASQKESEQSRDSFVDPILSTTELTAEEILDQHSGFLSEYVELDCSGVPVGWKDTTMVSTLKHDSNVTWVDSCLSVTPEQLQKGLKSWTTFEGGQICLGRYLGKGSFAQVFENEDATCALKLQLPPCPWEYFVMKEVQLRAGEDKDKFIAPKHCTLFRNVSLIGMEYHRDSCSLLDIMNSYRAQKKKMPEIVAFFYVSVLSASLHSLHQKCNIIHGDFKPDNILVCYSETAIPEVKVIDFGRSIDLTLLPSRNEEVNRECGSSFCMELAEKLPWSFNLDYLYLVELVYVLLFSEYPQKPYPAKMDFLALVDNKIPRYYNKELWMNLLEFLVNHVNQDGDLEQRQQEQRLLQLSKEFSSQITPKQQLKLNSLLRAERRMIDQK